MKKCFRWEGLWVNGANHWNILLNSECVLTTPIGCSFKIISGLSYCQSHNTMNNSIIFYF